MSENSIAARRGDLNTVLLSETLERYLEQKERCL